MIKLSILICTLPNRKEMLDKLIAELQDQVYYCGWPVEIKLDDSDHTIGEKRNSLLSTADGEYVCFIDDDDTVSSNYILLLLDGIKKGVDCCSLKGIYSVNNVFDGIFEHSIKYQEWKTTSNEIKYERYPNHLNCIKASIAKQFKFPEKNFGEDHDWSKQLHESGLLKTEHYIEQPIYFYKYISKK